MEDEINGYIQRDIAAGFRPESEIIEGVIELLSDDYDEAQLRPAVERQMRESLDAHLNAQKTWPETTDCDRLDQAFASLEATGILCRQDYSCCGTCGAGEIWDEMETMDKSGEAVRGYAFYHQQDTESAAEGHGLYLNYGSLEKGERALIAIAHEICNGLRAFGLTVDWDGDSARRIFVKLDWKKRRAPRCNRV